MDPSVSLDLNLNSLIVKWRDLTFTLVFQDTPSPACSVASRYHHWVWVEGASWYEPVIPHNT